MLSPVELGALGFAAYRGTQLIVHDSLLDGARARLIEWHVDGIRPGRRNRIRNFIRDLVACTYCAGWHVSWVALLTYLLASHQWQSGFDGFLIFGVQSFVVAGVQAILSRIDDTLPVRG